MISRQHAFAHLPKIDPSALGEGRIFSEKPIAELMAIARKVNHSMSTASDHSQISNVLMSEPSRQSGSFQGS